ncbi:MAG: hypothetical protein KY410_04990 [Proteobacteria bacterium]|nr:hypothetical protein [Pseudomonadota bacterium]
MNTLNTAIALLKRESWEHRSFWLVPGVLAVLIVIMFMWAMLYVIPDTVGYDLWVDRMADENPEAIDRIGSMLIPSLAMPFILIMGFMIPFYLLDSLYAERRDRSILFWKSLPINDTVTVLSKWGAVLLVLPAMVFGIVIVLSMILTLLTGIFTMFGGGNAWTLVWQHYGLFSGTGTLLVGFYAEALWYLPVMGWLLLASAWAKKAPFLWAVLPPVAIAILEEMFLDTNRFLEMVGERLIPFESSEGFDTRIQQEFDMFDGHLQFSGTPGFDLSLLGDLFVTPGFWYGLVFAAACTAGAVWLRRYRDES